MRRAVKVMGSGELRPPPSDTLILTREQRQMRHGTVASSKGSQIEFHFSDPVALRTDDVVLLDDGEAVEIVAAAEPLFEVRADVPALARLAWALGDRHVPVQFFHNRIRFLRDPALEPLLAAFGGKSAHIEAPFEPEGGAYARTVAQEHPDAHGHGHHDHPHHHGHEAHHDHGGAHTHGKDHQQGR